VALTWSWWRIGGAKSSTNKADFLANQLAPIKPLASGQHICPFGRQAGRWKGKQSSGLASRAEQLWSGWLAGWLANH